MKKDVDKEMAPVAVAIPHSDYIAIGTSTCLSSLFTHYICIENPFAEVWSMSLVPESSALPPMTVDLEDDIGGRSWRPVPQATNLRVPLSVMDISMQPVEIKKDMQKESAVTSPSKKSKKRKNAD